MIYQLRVYEIFEQNKDAFHDRFRDHAIRIMRRYDFDIAGLWETQSLEQTEFIYLLRWPDEATMRERWQAFMADGEWARIKRETNEVHGDMVGSISEKVMYITDYSPAV
jgi:hypothetical protein